MSATSKASSPPAGCPRARASSVTEPFSSPAKPMSELIYERPVIVKNPVGLMNKHGRRAELNTAAEIDGVPVDALCAEFGSPLFVFSERKLRAKVREARDAFARVGQSGRSPAAAQEL